MKKLFAVLLAAVLFTSAFCFTSTASGALIYRDDCEEGMKPNNWLRGDFNAFFAAEDSNGNGVLAGYHNAVVLQSNYGLTTDPKMWDKFYVAMDVNVRDLDGTDDSVKNGGVAMWYRDLFENETGDQGPVYTYYIDVTTGVATLTRDGHSVIYADADGNLKSANIPRVVLAEFDTGRRFAFGEWEEEEWFNMGMRVTDGRIECFLDQERIIDCKADPDDEHFGPWAAKTVDASVGSQRSAFLVINTNLYLYLDNFEVWEPGYADDFKGFVFGDADLDGSVTADDVVVILRAVAGWDTEDMEGDFDIECADVDLDGEVTLRDAVLIMQHLAGWRVTLGEAQ